MKNLKVTIIKNDGSDEFLEQIKVKVIDGIAQLDEQFYLNKYKTDLVFASRSFFVCRDYK